ncbi:BMP family ABC transporter substrate-binding protein [Eggerthellaceae bacterium zg-887]|nr:BMP family ABC transporter substrate-binding protein [Xiamenia xianingshaonis]
MMEPSMWAVSTRQKAARRASMKSETGKKYLTTLLSVLAAIAVICSIHYVAYGNHENGFLKIGFVYVGDASTAYTSNFMKAQTEIEKLYAENVETTARYNVSEDSVDAVLEELVDAGCGLIFTTSYGYGEKTKECAEQHPDVQFCQATCSNANEDPLLPNYHTFMGSIYQGKYLCGVVAGMKLKELIAEGRITPEQAKIGYVGAYPSAEVISDYTAFLLGARTEVPDAVMTVKYANTWTNYHLEKKLAKELIDEGCVVISQETDTSGPAAACEESKSSQEVYYVSYNESMRDIAPTTYLIGTRFNWAPYMTAATQAVLEGKDIEECVEATVHGNDAGAGFEQEWVQLLELNAYSAAEGTEERIEELVKGFKEDSVQVFYGDYTGTNPDDPSDTIDLREEYHESENCSAPTFHYVLDEVITIQ